MKAFYVHAFVVKLTIHLPNRLEAINLQSGEYNSHPKKFSSICVPIIPSKLAFYVLSIGKDAYLAFKWEGQDAVVVDLNRKIQGSNSCSDMKLPR